MPLFEKGGIDKTKAWIPIVNFIEWTKLVGRPTWHVALLFVPIVNLFIFCGMAIDLVRSFGYYRFVDSVLAVIYAPIKFFLMGKDAQLTYLGPTVPKEKAYREKIKQTQKEGNSLEYQRLVNNSPYRKSIFREWSEAIFFAVFAAAFIRMFLIEAYTIPTPSMENSLLVGDYLFVSKAHYGIRTPNTLLQIPLLHNRIPILGSESYMRNPQLKTRRLPALESIDRNDPVVFNWPVGDSVYVTSNRSWTVGQVQRMKSSQLNHPRLNELKNQVDKGDIIVRPLDKKDHYIKRCIGGPGDELKIVNRQVYINGEEAQNPKGMQYRYFVSTPSAFNMKTLEQLGIALDSDIERGSEDFFIASITPNQAAQLNAMSGVSVFNFNTYLMPRSHRLNPELVKSLNLKKGQFLPGQSQVQWLLTDAQRDSLIAHGTPITSPQSDHYLFPHSPDLTVGWDMDNYGPVVIPKQGMTIPLSHENLIWYERAIRVYEQNDVEVQDDRVLINGQEATEYTFKMDYYWMMGDNRHNSEDSRVWGFVPMDHVVGKPLFIWMSAVDGSPFKGIRWNRLFKSASK